MQCLFKMEPAKRKGHKPSPSIQLAANVASRTLLNLAVAAQNIKKENLQKKDSKSRSRSRTSLADIKGGESTKALAKRKKNSRNTAAGFNIQHKPKFTLCQGSNFGSTLHSKKGSIIE